MLDPSHSRPLDVHRWSDHPEVRALTDQIWEQHFKAAFQPSLGPGKRPKTDPKKQLRVLLLDLYLAWVQDPTLGIGVPMRPGAYDAGSRYNALHISPIMIELVHKAREVDLVHFWRGSEASGKVSRIWASERLIDAFRSAKFGVLDIGHFEGRESVLLSRGRPDLLADKAKGVELSYPAMKKWIPYEDTEETIRVRSKMEAYNRLLHQTAIDIPTLTTPIVRLPAKTAGAPPTLVRIEQSDKFVRRIYYRGSWDLGGRFHGGFWQRLPKEWRSRIYMNDRPVIEDDYSGLHVALLYGLAGQAMGSDDPYKLDSVTSFVPKQMRKWVKKLVLVAINASDEQKAFQAFRSEQPTGSPAKAFSNKKLKVMLDEFRRQHPLIADRLCSDAGVELMALDGRIASRVIDHFTAKGVPVLCIHDSFIVDHRHAGELRAVMLDAIKAEVPAASTSIDRLGRGFDQLPIRVFGRVIQNVRATRAYLGFVRETEGYRYRRDQFDGWLRSQKEAA